MLRTLVFKLLCLFMAIVGYCNILAAQNIDSIRTTVNFSNKPTVDFFNQLQKNHPIKIYYKQNWFKDKTISIKEKDITIKEILDLVIYKTPYLYEVIQGNQIIFVAREQKAMIMTQMVDLGRDVNNDQLVVIGKADLENKTEEAELSGRVTDAKTGNPLVGASVTVAGTTIGIMADADGYYNITLKPGIYTIDASNMSYEVSEYNIKLLSDGKFNIELVEKSERLTEVVIRGRRADANLQSSQMSIVELNSKGIKELPALVGEIDVIKSLTLMPGVKSVGEFGSGINVRGGGDDQNLYMIEQAPVFNTSHVLGLLSVINSDAVTNVTLYKGHIPADYGERVSSVMEIQIKDNNCKKTAAKGGIGLFNSRLMIEGPLFDKKLTYKFGGRTSYSDWLLTRIPDHNLQNSSASFFDLNGLINLKIRNNDFTLFAYNSFDRFKYASEFAYEYGNLLGSFSWKHFFLPTVSSVLTLAYSSYEMKKDDIAEEFEGNSIKSSVNYSSLKYNMLFTAIPKHTIKAGFQGINYNLQPGDKSPLDTLSVIVPQKLNKEQAYEGAIYVNDEYDINNKISINAGLRFSAYFFMGPVSVLHYDEDLPRTTFSVIDVTKYSAGEIAKQYFGFEPRLSLKYRINEKNSVKFSFNRNNQYISLISYTSVSTPDDIWKLSDNHISPMIVNQTALGYFRNFMNNTIEASIEVYYKQLKNNLEYKNDAQIRMNQHIETELINATGRNYGIELYIKKNQGKLDGWISYTYSRSLVKTDGAFSEDIINKNEYFPSSFDKPHQLTVMGTYHINRRWRVSANFNLASGRAVSMPEYQYKVGGNKIVYYSDRNEYQLPLYHRLDISVSIDESLKRKKKWKGSWSFSVLNIYARKNAYSVFYKKESPTSASDYKSFNMYKLLIIGKPIPTVTYNFIF